MAKKKTKKEEEKKAEEAPKEPKVPKYTIKELVDMQTMPTQLLTYKLADSGFLSTYKRQVNGQDLNVKMTEEEFRKQILKRG